MAYRPLAFLIGYFEKKASQIACVMLYIPFTVSQALLPGRPVMYMGIRGTVDRAGILFL